MSCLKAIRDYTLIRFVTEAWWVVEGEQQPLGIKGSPFEEMPIGYGEGAAKIWIKSKSDPKYKNPHRNFNADPEDMYLSVFLPNFSGGSLKTLSQPSPFRSDRVDSEPFEPKWPALTIVQKYILKC